MRTPRPKPRLEKLEQADGVKLLCMLGAAVYVSGTVRRAGDHQGTMQTPGIPDVQAFLPRCWLPAGTAVRHPPQLLCWEVKRQGGKMSAAQTAYRAHCLAAGVPHVVGDLTALMAWLVEHGYLRADQLPASRQRGTAL